MLLQHYFGKEPVENGMGEELPGWLDGREYSLSSPGAMTDAFSKSIKNGSFPNALNWLSKVGFSHTHCYFWCTIFLRLALVSSHELYS